MASKLPPPLSAPGKKKPVVEETTLVVSKPDVPKEPATEQGKVVISPEMVCFRTADEICRMCSHWGEDGNCSVLSMKTTEGDSCNAFAEREDGASDIEDPNEAMEMEPAA
jgi:hypothetical protein